MDASSGNYANIKCEFENVMIITIYRFAIYVYMAHIVYTYIHTHNYTILCLCMLDVFY